VPEHFGVSEVLVIGVTGEVAKLGDDGVISPLVEHDAIGAVREPLALAEVTLVPVGEEADESGAAAEEPTRVVLVDDRAARPDLAERIGLQRRLEVLEVEEITADSVAPLHAGYARWFVVLVEEVPASIEVNEPVWVVDPTLGWSEVVVGGVAILFGHG
jgi:hypothetical protein